MTIQEIYQLIDKAAPFSSALSFDNVGLLIGSPYLKVQKAMIVLDVTSGIIEEAVKKSVNLIISHHPVIFTPLKSIEAESIPYLLIQNQISVISCHTNLDLSPVCGVNIALGKALGLSDIHPADGINSEHILFVGELPEPLPPKVFAKHVKSALSSPCVKFYEGSEPVQEVAFCSGAGGQELSVFKESAAQAFVTGELKHHEELEAARLGQTVVTAGHFETEIMFAEELKQYLQSKSDSVEWILSACETSALKVL